MKKTPLILSIAALAVAVAALVLTIVAPSGKKSADEAASATGIEKGAIVYFNLDQVLEDYDMANDLRSVVETKVQSINEEVNRRGNKLQKDVNSFQEKIDKGLLTRSVAEVQSQKLQQQQNDFQQYAAQKQQEIQEEQAVMMNQIADAIKSYIDIYNAEKEFAIIIASQGDILPSPVVAGDGALDITEELLAGLNDEYIKTKAKGDKK